MNYDYIGATGENIITDYVNESINHTLKTPDGITTLNEADLITSTDLHLLYNKYQVNHLSSFEKKAKNIFCKNIANYYEKKRKSSGMYYRLRIVNLDT